jgi:hypothetical protein
MPNINDTIQKMLDDAFAGEENEPYIIGVRDAIESMTLALIDVIGDNFIIDAVQTIIDGILNNHNFDEDDGQPDEAQEWHDFNPDC